MYLNSRFFPSTTIENSVELGLSQIHNLLIIMSSLVAQMVKNLPAVQETRVWSLIQKDPLEKRMATHSSILAWRIPWTEEPGSPRGLKESDMTEATEHAHILWALSQNLWNIFICAMKVLISKMITEHS